MWKYCKNIVDVAFFFLFPPQISATIILFYFFPPIFGNAIATIAKSFFYSPISAMALPLFVCQIFFFFFLFTSGIPRTNSRTGQRKFGITVAEIQQKYEREREKMKERKFWISVITLPKFLLPKLADQKPIVTMPLPK